MDVKQSSESSANISPNHAIEHEPKVERGEGSSKLGGPGHCDGLPATGQTQPLNILTWPRRPLFLACVFSSFPLTTTFVTVGFGCFDAIRFGILIKPNSPKTCLIHADPT